MGYPAMTSRAGYSPAAFAAVLSLVVLGIDVGDPAVDPLRFNAPLSAAEYTRDDDGTLWSRVEGRHSDDLSAMALFRPGYSFWQHVFSIPDGSIAYGSALDGRRLVIFPARGDWRTEGRWFDETLASSLAGHELPRRLDERREYVAQVLAARVGPVVHNPTRGSFVAPGAQRYGRFLDEWAAIYERFGVPAGVGLAQALVESGFDGKRRSEAGAIGLCQWLRRNWQHLDRLDPVVIEVANQTTQAAYCAAYLSVLATKYGSFIPALSEHHAGGTNVGRTLVNGERLGGQNVRDQYFLGAQFARDLRARENSRYKNIYGTYGPRSYYYAEMVFGNIARVEALRASMPQVKIHAMRTTRAIPIGEITRRTGLSADEVRRFNPSLVRQVPRGATLYLPRHVPAFGRDVAFWHRPASAAFTDVLNEFVRLEATPEEWDDPAFDPTLASFESRFRQTKTEEGNVMATVLRYVRDEAATSGRRSILTEFRNSPEIRSLFEDAVRERQSATN
jgi:hypothetical protein